MKKVIKILFLFFLVFILFSLMIFFAASNNDILIFSSVGLMLLNVFIFKTLLNIILPYKKDIKEEE